VGFFFLVKKRKKNLNILIARILERSKKKWFVSLTFDFQANGKQSIKREKIKHSQK
jgi:hypothetical protein